MLSHRHERHLNADPRIKERNRRAAVTTWKRRNIHARLWQVAALLLGRVPTQQELSRLALLHGYESLIGTKWFPEQIDWNKTENR